jgi:hypothetical protein
LNPLIHEEPAVGGEALPTEEENWAGILEEKVDELVSRTDYEEGELGPQLLAVKSRARGMPEHLIFGTMGQGVRGADGEWRFVNRGLIHGLEEEDFIALAAHARRGLLETVLHITRTGTEIRKQSVPRGYGVLARALRSSRPGSILARAAAKGEVDPLADRDARLFVGILP